jgi:hypothetical protein
MILTTGFWTELRRVGFLPAGYVCLKFHFQVKYLNTLSSMRICLEGGNMKKHLLIIGIIFLFLSSVVAPMTTGINTDISEEDVELERMFDNLRFMCTTPDSFNSIKYEFYKEQLLSQYSSKSSHDDISIKSDENEFLQPVEQPSYPIVSSGGPIDSPWPMKCYDVRHTSQSPYSTVDTCAEKWRFKTDNWIEGGSVIGNDSTIYFGCFDYYLHALNPDGTEKWKYKTGAWIWSTPAIAEDGTIYIGAYDAKLYAINPNGTLKWKYSSGGSISSSPWDHLYWLW